MDSVPCSSAARRQLSIAQVEYQVEVMQFRYALIMMPHIVSNGLTFINIVNMPILKFLCIFRDDSEL